MYITVVFGDNNNPGWEHEVQQKVSEEDYNALKNYDMESYDDAWERLCDKFENVTWLPADWFIDTLKF